VADKAVPDKFEKFGKLIADITPKDASFEVSTLADPDALCNVKDWISYGCLPVDIVTGGGVPIGRVTEIYGDNSTGKTLMATGATIEAQERDILTYYMDPENALSRDRMEQLGVDSEMLGYCAPDTVGQLFDNLEKFLEGKARMYSKDYPALVVWDSVAATTTKEEVDTVAEKGLDQKQYSSAAQQISRAFRTGLPKELSRNNTALILINQIRQNVGVMFGDDKVTFGGKAIGFYSSVRIYLKSSSKIKSAGSVIGMRAKVTIEKNRLAPPFRTVEIPMYFDYGIDDAEATFDYAKDLSMVTGGASGWYSWPELLGEQKFQRAQWLEPDGLFDQHYDEIVELLCGKS
jgi:recombination protein RecA